MREIKNSLWLGLNYFNKLLGSIFFFSVLSKIVTVSFFGDLTYFLSILALFVAVSSFGLNKYVYIMVSTGGYDDNKLIKKSIKIQFVISVFLLCSFVLFYFFVDKNSYELIALLLLTISLLFKPAELLKVIFDSKLDSKIYFKLDLIISIVFILVKLLVVLVDASNLQGLLLVFSLESAVTALFYIRLYNDQLTNNYISDSTQKNKLSLGYRELLSGTFPILIASCIFMVYSRVDQYMIYNMLGSEKQAFYASALKISEGWYFIFGAIITSFFSSISKSFANDKVEFVNALKKLTYICNIVCYVVIIIVFVSSDYLISLIYGESYKEAAIVLNVMIFQSIIIASSFITYRVLLLEGLQKLSIWRAFIGLTLNVALNYIFIPTYGILGASICTLISHFFALFLSNLIFKRTRYIFFIQIKCLIINKKIVYDLLASFKYKGIK